MPTTDVITKIGKNITSTTDVSPSCPGYLTPKKISAVKTRKKIKLVKPYIKNVRKYALMLFAPMQLSMYMQ